MPGIRRRKHIRSAISRCRAQSQRVSVTPSIMHKCRAAHYLPIASFGRDVDMSLLSAGNNLNY